MALKVRQNAEAFNPHHRQGSHHLAPAALLEAVLDGKYAGFYDPPLLSDYAEMARLYMLLGQTDEAGACVDRILSALEKHMMGSAREDISQLLHTATPYNTDPTAQICKRLLHGMRDTAELAPFRASIDRMIDRWERYFAPRGDGEI